MEEMKSLRTPTSEVKFPNAFLINVLKFQHIKDDAQKVEFKKEWKGLKKDLDMTFSTYKKKLENNFLDYQKFIISISLTDADVKYKKKKQYDYLKKLQDEFKNRWIEISKETGRDLMMESTQEIKDSIARWDAFDVNWKNDCKDNSIQRLENIIEMDITKSYKELFQSYLDRMQDKKTVMLQAGNFDHKKKFDLLKLNAIIEGNFNSWNYYFNGADCKNPEPITWNWKKSELLYFLSKYCVDFGTYEEKNRKISDANKIFGNILKTTDEIAGKTKNTTVIAEILK